MYSFKSGIIFYNRVDLSSLENEGHSILLENLNIEDTGFNSYKKFVKAELCPPNKKYNNLQYRGVGIQCKSRHSS